ncbi:MAG TPA: alpha/beta hydrolase [Caulobacteraceae bacterium]|nr:alpha/beta hydrolase [Caulobacteraceae bacterium]
MDADPDYQPRADRVRLETPTGAGEMAFLDYGPPERPPAIVFLHANGFNARSYRTILAPLAGDLRILTPDQRGHGATALPIDHSRTSWLDLKDDLLAFLKAMRLERVVLAGHSMGGTASLLASAEAPERVRALALFDPVILPPAADRPAASGGLATASPMVQGAMRRRREFPSKQAAVDAYRGRGAFRTWTEAMLADYVEAGFRERDDGSVELTCSPEWEVSNYVNQQHDSWAAFDASRAPTWILRAELDSPGRLDGHVDRLTASGRIRIDTVPGTTHFLPMERTDLVREALTWAAAQP